MNVFFKKEICSKRFIVFVEKKILDLSYSDKKKRNSLSNNDFTTNFRLQNSFVYKKMYELMKFTVVTSGISTYQNKCID